MKCDICGSNHHPMTECRDASRSMASAPCSTILLSDWKPDYRIQFHSRQNNEIGRLTWNDGVLRFTGNADESAKLFIQTMAAQLGMPFDLSNGKDQARAALRADPATD